MSSYSQTFDLHQPAFVPRFKVSSLARAIVPSLGAVVFAVALVHILFLSAGTRTLFRDSDTGWHIRNGEAILAARSVPRTDSFSYTSAGAPWFSWEWGSDLIVGTAHRLAGPAGVAFLAALVIALVAWGAARLALSLGGNLLLTAVASGLLLGSTSIHWLARPHIFSWLIALGFLAIAEHERRKPGKAIYWLPALACLWANLHGSFPLGPGILFLYAAGDALAGSERRKAAVRFALAGIASLAATLINPYGWNLHAHVISYLQNTYLMDHISEFRSFSFHAPGAIYVELSLAIVVLGIIALFSERAYGPALLGLALLHLSLYSARHLPTTAVLLLPLSVAALTRHAENWPRLRPLLEYSQRLRAIDLRVAGVVPVMLVLVASLGALVPLARAGRVGFDPAVFPAGAADFLEQQGIARGAIGPVFAKDQWGGYLIYRFDGRLKVFLDGRSDFYGRDMLETYATVMDVKPGWNEVLRRYNVRSVLVPPDHALVSVLSLSPGWQRVYADSVSTVFERMD
jgi:hypothetical protein